MRRTIPASFCLLIAVAIGSPAQTFTTWPILTGRTARARSRHLAHVQAFLCARRPIVGRDAHAKWTRSPGRSDCRPQQRSCRSGASSVVRVRSRRTHLGWVRRENRSRERENDGYDYGHRWEFPSRRNVNGGDDFASNIAKMKRCSCQSGFCKRQM